MSLEIIVPKGIYHDRLISPGRQIIDLGWRPNIIVDRCRYLLAAFMKNNKVRGIQLFAVGKGLESWDDEAPPPPSRTDEELTDPNPLKIKIKPKQIKYLDATGAPVSGPTHRLRITITLEPGTPAIESGETSYPMREFGLFGQFGSEEYMIDYVRHPVIHKLVDDILERTIHLIF